MRVILEKNPFTKYEILKSCLTVCGTVDRSIRVFSNEYQVALVVKNPPANAGDRRDAGLIPGSGRSPGGGPGNPFQCSCPENPVDGGAWWATVHGVSMSQILLK